MIPAMQLARIAGILYLILGIAGAFSQLVVRQSILVPGDASTTADNIRASATQVQIGFATDVVNIVCFVLVALTLHALLAPVSRRLSMAFVVFNVIAAAIIGVSLMAHAGALLVATDLTFAGALGGGGSDALALLLLEMHARGYLVAEVFFGLWLLPLGYVVHRSGMFPRALGIALMVGCFGYLASFAITVASSSFHSDVASIFALPAGLAEIAFIFWLLIRGVRVPAPSETTGSPAVTPA